MPQYTMVYTDGTPEVKFDDLTSAQQELEQIAAAAQDQVADSTFKDPGHEYATLYCLDQVGFGLPERTPVATVVLRVLGEAGDGSEAGRRAEEAGVDFWAEVAVEETELGLLLSSDADPLKRVDRHPPSCIHLPPLLNMSTGTRT